MHSWSWSSGNEPRSGLLDSSQRFGTKSLVTGADRETYGVGLTLLAPPPGAPNPDIIDKVYYVADEGQQNLRRQSESWPASKNRISGLQDDVGSTKTFSKNTANITLIMQFRG